MKQCEICHHELVGRIVLATVPYGPHDLVCVGNPRGMARVRDAYSVQVSEHEHVYLQDPANLLSHSCDPNLYIRDNDVGAYSFYATRNIQPGEVLAFHYGMCEAEVVAFSVCHCGSPRCTGTVTGFKAASLHVQDELYRLGVAAYLREWYERARQG
jgi:hypothetical protein